MQCRIQIIQGLLFASCALVTFASNTLAADSSSCSTVRLDQNGGPFEKLPVYDQNRYAKDDTNLCYAVTASLLIDAHRRLNNQFVPPFTAPLSVALNYKTQQTDLPIETRDPVNPSDPSMLAYSLVGGGSISTAVNANQSQKVCDQRFLQSFDDAIGIEQFKNVAIGSDQDSTTENFLKSILDQIEKYRRSSQVVENATARAESLNSFFRCRTDQGVSNMRDILQAARIANRAGSPIMKASVFLRNLCQKNSFVIKVPRAQSLEGYSGDFLAENMALDAKLSDSSLTEKERQNLGREFQEKFDPKKKTKKLDTQINLLLNSETPTPIGIGYCHESLKTTAESICQSGHASVIIGRRFISETGACEFLVRDSYGPNCNDVDGKPKYAWPCENGNVWIPSDKLLRSASSVTWIPNRSAPN